MGFLSQPPCLVQMVFIFLVIHYPEWTLNKSTLHGALHRPEGNNRWLAASIKKATALPLEGREGCLVEPSTQFLFYSVIRALARSWRAA